MKRIDPRQAGAAGGPAAGVPAALALGALTLVAALALAPRAYATTYKWVDDKGVIQYSDKLPPEAINKGNVELDKQGVPIRKNDPALTPEQRKAKAADEARAQQLAKEREVVERRDRALLATYTTENEIDLARNRALSTIDAQVQSANAYSATLSKRKVELDQKKAALGDKPVPPAMEREMAAVSTKIVEQADLIAAKQKEIVVVNQRYDTDKKRWAELRATTEAAMNGTVKPAPTASVPASAKP